ncbi:MAG: hypothetical protein HY661_16510 [Betaproteobacteria bacterium]|nr:hypothetical protein [Betaproteobacteria bacterium]
MIGRLQSPQVITEKLNPLGLDAAGITPERFMEIMRADVAKSAKFTKEANIRSE